MTPELTIAFQLVLLALCGIFAVWAASSARRAASFDVTRDFDALASVVNKLAAAGRSQRMKEVRAAALVPAEPAQPAPNAQQAGLTHDQLRAIARAKYGSVQ